MKKITYCILILSGINAYAVIPSPMEGTLSSAQAEALAIKGSCIDTPPLTPAQVSWCSGHYSTYVGYLTLLQSPYPLTLNTGADGYQSPYSWSPYDICRFEPGRLINVGIC